MTIRADVLGVREESEEESPNNSLEIKLCSICCPVFTWITLGLSRVLGTDSVSVPAFTVHKVTPASTCVMLWQYLTNAVATSRA